MKLNSNFGATAGMYSVSIIKDTKPRHYVFFIAVLLLLSGGCIYLLEKFLTIPIEDNYLQIEGISPTTDNLSAEITLNIGCESRFNTYDTISYILNDRDFNVTIFQKDRSEDIDDVEYWLRKENEIRTFISNNLGEKYLNIISNSLKETLERYLREDGYNEPIDLNQKIPLRFPDGRVYDLYTTNYLKITTLFIVNIIQNIESTHFDYNSVTNKDAMYSVLNIDKEMNLCEINGEALYDVLTKNNKRQLSKKHTYGKTTRLIAGYNANHFSKAKQDKFEPERKVKWILSPYDISRKNYKLTICSQTIEDVSAIVKFTGPVSNFIFPGVETKQYNGYLVIPQLKTVKNFSSKSNVYNYYVEFPELENIQYIRLFFITALLSLLITAIFKCFIKLIKASVNTQKS